VEVRAYEGVWVLDSEASSHGEHPLPERGVYTIVGLRSEPGALRFHAAWRAEGQRQATTFTVVPGQVQTLEPGVELHTHLDEHGLITQVRQGSTVAHHARRTVDGDVLTVEQRVGDEPAFTGIYRRTRVKQVIAYRRDLKMRKGKIAAQCAHASLGVLTRSGRVDQALTIPLDGPRTWWLTRGAAKIVLSVADEPALLDIESLAREHDLPHCLITDSGRTEFGGVPTRTAIALGPAPAPWIDAITGPRGVVETKLA